MKKVIVTTLALAFVFFFGCAGKTHYQLSTNSTASFMGGGTVPGGVTGDRGNRGAGMNAGPTQ